MRRRSRALRPPQLVVGALALGLLVPAAAAAAPASVRAELDDAAGAPRELRPTAVIALDGGATIHRYRQSVGGIPVDGAEAVVVEPASGPADLVTDTTRRAIAEPGAPRLGRAAALERAREEVGAERLRDSPRGRLVVDPGGGGTLAWRVMVPAARPLGDFLVLVDAASGAVLSVDDLLRRGGACSNPENGCAKLFVPNAVVANDGYRDLHDHGDRNTKLLSHLRRPVAVRRLDAGQDCLKGRWANVKLGLRARKVCNPSGDWRRRTRHDNRFEAVMAYWHLDRTQLYLRDLEVTPSGDGDLNDESQFVVANGLRADNSFYSPGQDEIRYGTGGVDDAEDADVIVHEYGHAVQDAAVKHFGREFGGGAMGEGFSDYLAGVMSSQVTDDPEWNACVAEWDATSYDPRPSCLRRLDNPRDRFQIADQCGHEIHCVGQAWSSGLWDLRAVLGPDSRGRSIVDRIVLTSHFLLTPDSGLEDGANALLCADEALYPDATPDDCRGDHWDTIRLEMESRRFLP